jgi:hypothetical protein
VKLFFKFRYSFWFYLSVLTAIVFSFSGLKIAFQSSYTLQDDARQYIFWMQQFRDNALFQNDLIANYFKSVTPVGFSGLYRLISSLGIDVFLFNKISILLIGLATTVYCFKVCYLLFPIPFAGFVSCLLLNQNLWMVDDLSSGTPRAFIYVLLLAFIYYLLRRNLILYLLTLVLQGLFYPQAILISLTIIFIRLCTNKKHKYFEAWGLFFGVLILFIYSFQISDFTPVVTASQAKLLPEFQAGSRSAFFSNNWIQFWLSDRRSGFFPVEWQYSLMCIYGISLFWLKKHPTQFPLVKYIKPQIKILSQLFIASTLLFFLAHLLLFKLHLPGRYTHHTIRIIIALVNGITISILWQKLLLWIDNSRNINKIFQPICLTFLFLALLYPTYAVQNYPERLGYKTTNSEQLYQFLKQQPKNTFIATLSEEADFIPSLAARSVLIAREYAIPYHRGYYNVINQRVKELIEAQYSLNEETVINFIRKYQITLWLIDNSAFEVNYLTNNSWLQQFQPEINRAVKNLKNESNIILKNYSDLCTLFQTKNSSILDTSCILNSID